jgi:Lon protease-like protein
MTETVALFPIPDVVAFPGTVVPLHVFEPRYRQMVNDAVDEHRMIGVTNTRKQIHAGRKHDTVAEALASNQATYQPHEVFSAGHCEVLNRTEDGRIHLVVRAEKRLRLVSEVQTLPYRIVEAEVVLDEPEPEEENRALQQSINDRLLALVSSQDPSLAEAMTEEKWVSLPPAEFSFKVFQFLRFGPDLMQALLESTRASERLETIDEVLQSVVS